MPATVRSTFQHKSNVLIFHLRSGIYKLTYFIKRPFSLMPREKLLVIGKPFSFVITHIAAKNICIYGLFLFLVKRVPVTAFSYTGNKKSLYAAMLIGF